MIALLVALLVLLARLLLRFAEPLDEGLGRLAYLLDRRCGALLEFAAHALRHRVVVGAVATPLWARGLRVPFDDHLLGNELEVVPARGVIRQSLNSA